MEALTIVYRPKILEDIVGQPHVTTIIKAMVNKNSLPPVLIFGGASGTGKTSTARVLAAALNCQNKQGSNPCGTCAICISVWSSQNTSVTEIDAASSDTMDAVHRIKELTYYAHQEKWRVIILDEAQSMSDDAFNVLLKILEEPLDNTVFVLLTTEVFKIPTTIRTRSMQFEFKRLGLDTIVKKLSEVSIAQEFAMESDMLIDIAKNSKGSLRDAIMQLDQASKIGIKTSEQFKKVFGISNNSTFILSEILNKNKVNSIDLISDTISRTGSSLVLVDDLIELMRDLIIIKSHGTPPCLPNQLTERQNIAAKCSDYQLVAAIKLLWQSKDKLRLESDQMTSGQILGLLLWDIFNPETNTNLDQSSLQPIIKNESRESALSLGEMQDLVNSL